MATLEGLPDPSQVSAADSAARAAQAEAANQAYRQGTAPVLSRMGSPVPSSGAQEEMVLAYDRSRIDPVTGMAPTYYITASEDAAREYDKHMMAFHPQEYFGANIGDLANTPLSSIASRYGTQFADYVQGYYTTHPTAQFTAINAQYAQQQARTIGTEGIMQQRAISQINPYSENSAAGISWLIARQQGGTITESMREKAIGEVAMTGGDPIWLKGSTLSGSKMVAGIATVKGMETVPIRDLSYEATQYGGGGNVGNRWEAIALENVKFRPGYTAPSDLGDPTTQKILSGYRMFDQAIGLTGGRIASEGMITGQVLEWQRQTSYNTPAARDERFFSGELQKWAQNMVETSSAYHHVGMDAGVPIPANKWEYQGDLAVEFLKGMPTRSSEWFSPVSGEMGAILPKGEGLQQYAWREAVAGSRGQSIGQIDFSQAVKYLGAAEGRYGPYGKLAGGIDNGGVVLGNFQESRLRGSKVVASTPIYGGEAIGMKDTLQEQTGLTKYDRAVLGGYSGGLIGYTLWGEKAPEVIKGAVFSGVDFVTGIFGWTPGADAMREQDPQLKQFRTEKSSYESNLTSLVNTGKSQFGTTAAGEIKIDTTSPAALAWQKQYETAKGDYSQFMQSSKDKGLVVFEKGQMIENPDLTYNYGEFTKWGIGAGKQVQGVLGFNKAQLEQYGTQLEQKKGIEYIPEKIVYGTGYTLSTHPEKIISAYIGGAGMVFGGEVVAGIGEGTGITAALGRGALAHPTAAAAVGGFVRYGIPAALLGATYYGASEGLTASPERTTINIGKMTPELGGVILGGASGYGALRAADAGFLGFGTKKIEYAKGYEPREIVLPGEPITRPGVMGTIESPLQLPAELARRSAAEPYARIGSTRLSESSFILEEPGKMPTLPGVRPLLSGQEMGSVSMDSRLGFMDLGKSKTSAAISMDQLMADYARFSQPPSARTTLMREQQALAWQAPKSTGVLPMDFLPGTGKAGAPSLTAMSWGKPTLPEPFAGEILWSPKGMGGKAGEAGLTFRGAPMSEQMLAQVTTRGPVKLTSSMSIEEMIQNIQLSSRVKPVKAAAEAQSIVPSATAKTFKRSVKLEGFEDTLKGVMESEKRSSVTSGRLPKGMQLDYLRESMKGRSGINLGKDLEPFRPATEAEISRMIQPTKRPAQEWLIKEEIASTRRPATEAEISRMIRPTSKAATYEELQKMYGKAQEINSSKETYPWANVKMGREMGPTRQALSDYTLMERKQSGRYLFMSDAVMARQRTGVMEVPGLRDIARSASGSRSSSMNDTVSLTRKQEREMQNNLMGSMSDQRMRTNQMSVPDLVPVLIRTTKTETIPPYTPTYEKPGKNVPDTPMVPTIPRGTEPVIPKSPTPTIPIYTPDIPLPKIPIGIPSLGSGGASGFGMPRGGFRFVERLSFASGAYRIAVPGSAPRAAPKKKAPSRRTSR